MITSLTASPSAPCPVRRLPLSTVSPPPRMRPAEGVGGQAGGISGGGGEVLLQFQHCPAIYPGQAGETVRPARPPGAADPGQGGVAGQDVDARGNAAGDGRRLCDPVAVLAVVGMVENQPPPRCRAPSPPGSGRCRPPRPAPSLRARRPRWSGPGPARPGLSARGRRRRPPAREWNSAWTCVFPESAWVWRSEFSADGQSDDARIQREDVGEIAQLVRGR